jgi:hypothetical protein
LKFTSDAETNVPGVPFTVSVRPVPAGAWVGEIVVITGAGLLTVSDTVLLVAPAPPSVDVMALVVLLFEPVVEPVMLTTIVQLPPAAIVPDARLMLPDPALAVVVPAQVLLNPFGVATTSPLASVSLKATPLSAVPAFGLVMVKVSVVLAPTRIVPVPNAFVMVGGATTVTVAVLLAAPAPVSVAETAPVVLAFAPAVVPVTLTMSVHDADGASVMAERLIDADPATSVTVPVQVPA